MTIPARIPQHVSASEQVARSARLVQLRYDHRWVRSPSSPPHLVDPARAHPGLRCSRATERYVERELRMAAVNRGLGMGLRGIRRRIDAEWRSSPGLSRYHRLGPLVSTPEQARRHWRDDRYFAWSLVAGANPMQLRLCEELPRDCTIRDAHVRGLLPAGLDLGAAMARRQIFLADFSILEGLGCLPGRYLAAPRLLLWLDDSAQLSPLAIQLRPDSDPERRPAPVFTPLDSTWDWLSARAWVQNASNHTQQALFHLLDTHFVGEALAISMHRNLAPEHPLYRLLEPHLRECVGINEKARTLLLGKQGLVDRSMSVGGRGLVRLIEEAWPRWRWDERSLPGDLESRQLASSAVLPEFPYRDDAQDLRETMRVLVEEQVRAHYAEDAEVGADPELQAWLADLGDPEGGSLFGLPAVASLTALVEFATEVMFKVSAQHHAMQAEQKQAYGFAPFTPAGLYEPPAERHGEGSEASFSAMLPGFSQALSQLGSAHILTREVEHPLLGARHLDIADDAPLARRRAHFQSRLRVLSATIAARNARRWLPYTALDPATMATCIDI